MKRLLPLLLTLSLAASPVFADPLEDGRAALDSQDYARAYEILFPLAEAGDPQALYLIGYMYIHGYGVNKDPDLAARYLQLSSSTGHPKASYLLGLMYFHGESIAEDRSKARDLFYIAARACDAEAAAALGGTLLGSPNPVRDRPLGFGWLYVGIKWGSETAGEVLAPYLILHGEEEAEWGKLIAIGLLDALDCPIAEPE